MTIINALHTPKSRKILKAYGVKRIALFGSSVNGTAKKSSDVDLLVEFKSGTDLLDQIGLKQDLESVLGKRVDVVTPQALSKYIRKQVLKEAVYL